MSDWIRTELELPPEGKILRMVDKDGYVDWQQRIGDRYWTPDYTMYKPSPPKAWERPSPENTKGRWYAIDREGMATLCADEADAIKNAKAAAEQFPRRAPYVAAQLVALPVGWKIVPPWNNWVMRGAMRQAMPSIPGDLLDHALSVALAAAPEPPQ